MVLKARAPGHAVQTPRRTYLILPVLALVLSIIVYWSQSANSSSFVTAMGDNRDIAEISEPGNAFKRLLNNCVSFFRSTATKRGSTTANSKQPASQQQIHQVDHKQMPQTTLLYKAIQDGTFWTMPDDDLLVIIRDEFPDDLARLKRAYSVKTTGIKPPSTPSISQRLYGEEYDEINRTLVGVLALRWVHHRDYNTFIGSQAPPPIVLKPESFAWLCDTFEAGLHNTDDIYTLVLSMIINDLGKDPNLATDYASLKQIDISNVNHDMILLHAVEAGMVPALDSLTTTHRDETLVGIKLGAEFNFGQLAQSENAPASLAGLLEVRGHDRAFEMRFMEQILDLSGASGHEDWTCARKMIEPIFQSYKNVHAVASNIISGKMGLRDGYDIILTRKLALLQAAGYERTFDVAKPLDRALLRLFCMGNTNGPANANLYYDAFMAEIDESTRAKLVEELNRDGSVEAPAVQPTYIPAMLSKATNNTPQGSHEEKVRAITAVLKYLERCLEVTPSTLKALPKGVTVIERDIRKVEKVLDGEAFKHDPSVLDSEAIPEDQVANMVRE